MLTPSPRTRRDTRLSANENPSVLTADVPPPEEEQSTAAAALEAEVAEETGVSKALVAGLATMVAAIAGLAATQPGKLTALAAALGAVLGSGFTAAFSLVFVSEIGDKTFFIAALLAARYGRTGVMVGAVSALAAMTVVSVALGRIFQSMPSFMQTSLPVGDYLAVALLIFFGVRTLQEALAQPGAESDEEGSEYEDAEEFLKEADETRAVPTTQWGVIVETFTLIFVAEWGDRSMLATIALGAAQNPFAVAGGAIAGHTIATLIAVIGGAFLSKHISERAIGVTGGVLFLLFAAATAGGVF